MLDAGTFRGARGLVKHAYHTAAEVTAFLITFDRTTRRTTLGATVVTSDPYWLTQRPLIFVVPTKGGACRWPIETVTIGDGRLVANLGGLMERE
jgi:hypothetical protein